ncbi:hypothetical protein FHX59_000360 [Paraburkholderia silvatlantica]|uniref:Uncharacterized protein n=1 Tax=Paraburkholderia silvatlantica TaxID=321895 RepID=A0ABR6FEU5_9BURK|nr:hypothetical protein [Paraburkholderia silvatlantica]
MSQSVSVMAALRPTRSANAPITRAAQPAVHLVAPLGEALRDEVARDEFFEAQFGMRVDLVAQCDHLFFDRGDCGRDSHRVHGIARWSAWLRGAVCRFPLRPNAFWNASRRRFMPVRLLLILSAGGSITRLSC